MLNKNMVIWRYLIRSISLTIKEKPFERVFCDSMRIVFKEKNNLSPKLQKVLFYVKINRKIFVVKEWAMLWLRANFLLVTSHFVLVTSNCVSFAASSFPCREVRDSWITKASEAIIIAFKISERKASQRRREVFS